jgi:hypothetical protein
VAFGKQRSSGPVREGPALLQGRVLCGICGAPMTMQYHVREKLLPIYMCQEDSVRRGRRLCQQIRGVALDQAISAFLLELITPMTVDIALAVQQGSKHGSARRMRCGRHNWNVPGTKRSWQGVDT